MKNRKWFIISEIAFGVVYVVLFLVTLFLKRFDDNSNTFAAAMFVLYFSMGITSAFFDFLVLNKTPTVRTVGAFALGGLLFLGFLENNPFGF